MTATYTAPTTKNALQYRHAPAAQTGPRVLTPEMLADRLLAEADRFQSVELRAAQNSRNRYRATGWNAGNHEAVIQEIGGKVYTVNLRTRICACPQGLRALELEARLRHLPEALRPIFCCLECRHASLADYLLAEKSPDFGLQTSGEAESDFRQECDGAEGEGVAA